MATENPNNNNGIVEFKNLMVDYSDGDIVIFDNVRDLSEIKPIKPMTNLIGLCVKGSIVMTVNGKDSKIKEDDILFCPPNVKIDHCVFSEDFECKLLCLSNHVLQGLAYLHKCKIAHLDIKPQNIIINDYPSLGQR